MLKTLRTHTTLRDLLYRRDALGTLAARVVENGNKSPKDGLMLSSVPVCSSHGWISPSLQWKL